MSRRAFTVFIFSALVVNAVAVFVLAREHIRRTELGMCPEGAVMVVVAGEHVPGGFDTLVRGDGGWVSGSGRR